MPGLAGVKGEVRRGFPIGQEASLGAEAQLCLVFLPWTGHLVSALLSVRQLHSSLLRKLIFGACEGLLKVKNPINAKYYNSFGLQSWM